MKEKKVFFLVVFTSNKNLHQWFLCPYCSKLFYSENFRHPCLNFTKGKEWTEIRRVRNDCNFFILYMFNKLSKGKGDSEDIYIKVGE